MGAKTYLIGAQPDGYNINANAGSTHIEVMQKFVLENKLDVGFSYDGDADRCLCVDEKGNVITGDHILYIYGKYMKERGKLVGNTVVTTVMSNLGLYRALYAEGIAYEQTTVGDRYIWENMKENRHSLGGEQSGHIILSKYATTGDGILTAIALMDAMIEQRKPLSVLASPVRMLPQITVNVRVSNKAGIKNHPLVQDAVERAKMTLGKDGRILLRESGTEPVLRVMVEALTEKECRELAESVAEVIRNAEKQS
jgi:phosphoglucosamine mutase